jgi:hypothetical protein
LAKPLKYGKNHCFMNMYVGCSEWQAKSFQRRWSD